MTSRDNGHAEQSRSTTKQCQPDVEPPDLIGNDVHPDADPVGALANSAVAEIFAAASSI